MRLNGTDTIFAPASGFGRSAICVIRVSGPGSRGILEGLTGSVPSARRLVLRRLKDPANGEILDEGLVVFMPGPGTFTGEDQAELHIHGGLATRMAVLRAIGALPECRPAQAGEFARRAFLNGRLDLTRAEALADLIDAETEAQRRQAFRQLDGRLARVAEDLRETLLEALAMLEAALDFSDEGDVALSPELEVEERLGKASTSLAEALANPVGERLREGLTVVLAGPPNAGKSSLLNRLAQRDVAIVSAIPGTTRDLIEARLDLHGLPLVVVDTAGLREGGDAIEQEGIARARARAAHADLVLWLSDGGSVAVPEGITVPVLRLATKADIVKPAGDHDVAVSTVTGAGISDLLVRLEEMAAGALDLGEAVLTRERHRRVFERALDAVQRARAELRNGAALELAAEDIRLASRAIGEITGRVDVEDVLDRLFSTFCIGK